jgi:hypothetical protein
MDRQGGGIQYRHPSQANHAIANVDEHQCEADDLRRVRQPYPRFGSQGFVEGTWLKKFFFIRRLDWIDALPLGGGSVAIRFLAFLRQ